MVSFHPFTWNGPPVETQEIAQTARVGAAEKRCLRRHGDAGGRVRLPVDRTSGGHHIFSHPDIPEMINLQEVKGEAKPYQIRQFLKIVERHDLRLEDEG